MPEQVPRQIAERLYGRIATDRDMVLLRSRLPDSLVADWLVELLEQHGLAGVCFSLNKDKDNSGLGAELIWLTPEQIASEANDSEPGRSVINSRFLPIGSCGIASGDPY